MFGWLFGKSEDEQREDEERKAEEARRWFESQEYEREIEELNRRMMEQEKNGTLIE